MHTSELMLVVKNVRQNTRASDLIRGSEVFDPESIY